MTDRMRELTNRFLTATNYDSSVLLISEYLVDTILPEVGFDARTREQIVSNIHEAVATRRLELREVAAAVYADHFTEDDMAAAVAWVESAAGRHFAEVQSAVIADAQQRANAVLTPIFQEIARKARRS